MQHLARENAVRYHEEFLDQLWHPVLIHLRPDALWRPTAENCSKIFAHHYVQ
jgi:hypothetical protein